MLTTISSILKLSGVHSIKNIIRLNVTMLTIGKISEENHISLTTMLMNYALTGKLVPLLESMRKVAFCKLPVSAHMVGRNKSTTLSTTKQDLAQKLSAGKYTSALSIIMIKIVDW